RPPRRPSGAARGAKQTSGDGSGVARCDSARAL
ncbi:MAG: hypothetical protein AVDCRST_MAG93-5740, partial [uncultured Chloroflexia bacterium]